MMKNKKLIKMEPQRAPLAGHVKEILEMLGEDPSREGLVQDAGALREGPAVHHQRL